MDSFLSELSNNIAPNPEEKLYPSIWKEYERVILDSLITTFGLDFLVHDQRGGDVDTIHSVQETNVFKNEQYSVKYQNRGEYNSQKYHGSDKAYRDIGHSERNRFNETGETIPDTYVPNNLLYYNKGAGPWRQTSLDHVISAHEIHDDPVRILFRNQDRTQTWRRSERNALFPVAAGRIPALVLYEETDPGRRRLHQEIQSSCYQDEIPGLNNTYIS